MKRSILFTTSLAVAAGLFALGATAQQQAQAKTRISISEIATILEGKGYTVLEIELEHGRYDVEMINSDGMRVEAYLNPITGEVLPYRDDDDNRDDRYED